MGLRFNREDATHGALIVGKVQSLESAFKTTAYNTVPPIPGMDWGLLAASTDGYVLTCSAAAAEGVAWAAPAVPTALSTFTATAGAFSGGIAAWGATLPSAQPATTGTVTGYTTGTGTTVTADGTFTGHTGTSAYTIGDIVLALKQQGFLAP